MANFTIKGTVPTALVEEFIQVLRNFEQKHPTEIHLGMLFDVHELTLQQVELIFGRVQPGFPYQQIFKRGEKHEN